jgi:hypothetical protein
MRKMVNPIMLVGQIVNWMLKVFLRYIQMEKLL